MTTPPLRIPPPGTVQVAAALVALKSLALWFLAGITLASGIRNHARGDQLAAQTAYFVVLGALLILVALGLMRGRRWAHTPAIVAEVVTLAVGVWLAFPSAQVRWGLVVCVVAGTALTLLVTPAANHWIKQFPRPFQ